VWEASSPRAVGASLQALRTRLGIGLHPGRLGPHSLFASACVDAHVSAYLLTTRVPPRGTVCAPDVVPFAQPPAAQAQQAAGASKAALLPPALRQLLSG
jgi:hypothetical protein